jgi:hypothetical protein
MKGRCRRGESAWMPARDQLLAGAALAQDQHGAVDGGDLHHPLQHLLHLLRLAHDAGDLAQLLALHQPAAHQRHLLGVHRLGEALAHPQLAADLAPRGLGGLREPDHGDAAALARLRHHRARAALAQPAGDHQQDRLAQRVGQALAGREQLHAQPVRLERAAQPDGRLQVIGGDQYDVRQSALPGPERAAVSARAPSPTPHPKKGDRYC